MIHDDCRTTDALNFLNKQIHNIDSSHKDETDTWLEKLFNGELLNCNKLFMKCS